MVRVKKILLIVCFFLGWNVACVKHNGSPVMGSPVPPDSGVHTTAPADSLSYLALGDSYTIGESVDISDRYPIQVIRRLKADTLIYKTPDIIAVTGWTTGNLLAAMPATVPDTPYHVVSLLIGVNNQFQRRSQAEYRTQFTDLLQRSIQLAGNRSSHVIVLSIPDYSVTPFARGRNTSYIAAQIDSFNAINKEISLNYKVAYIDVTTESRKAANEPTLIAGDSLHFSAKEYDIWAQLMEPVMKGIH